MKKIETRENEFVEQLSKLLLTLFPKKSPAGFALDYYLGETENNTKGLCFEITSKGNGVLYTRVVEIKSYETPYDVEEQFISTIMNELVLTGIGFIYLQKLEKDKPTTNDTTAGKIQISLN